MNLCAEKQLRAYEEKKARVSTEIRKNAEKCQNGVVLDKKTSNLFRSSNRRNASKRIDVREFNKVISVDAETFVATVEGMTTYEELVKETLKHGCLPTVVPELKSITIGGALAGCGIESSSFRYGLVHETITEFDVLLGDGSVVTCTADNDHSALFFAFPNSYGTLGYALKVKVKLIPTKKYVKLTHRRFSESTLFFKELARLCTENREGSQYAYIDSVIFSAHEQIITLGEFADEAPYSSSYQYMNIYYRSLQTREVDYLTTLDYIWRWDADWFWCSKVFGMQNSLLRFIFGKYMLSSKVYSKIMHGIDSRSWLSSALGFFRGRREAIIQDALIPADKAETFYAFFRKEIGITPIWVCPTQPYSKIARYPLCPLEPGTLYFDFGFWDSIQSDKADGTYNRKIEKIVAALEGFKSLYSSSYYSEEEFWEQFDRSAYYQLKKEYDPDNRLKDLYAKCTHKG